MAGTEKQQRIDREIAEIAARQHGLIETGQLAALMNHASIRQRAGGGRLHRKFRGVYSVGHEVLTQEGRWLAAVLASGPTAALSHRSAAHHLGLIDKSPEWFVEVTANTRGRRSHKGIHLYETTRLDFQFTVHEGIRTTTAARTIADLAAVSTQRVVEKAISRAEMNNLITVRDLLDAARYRKGAPMIRKIMGDPTVTETRSPLEDEFLALVARFALPTPKANHKVGGEKVDFLWEEQRLVVETDGDAVHLARSARHRDRKRDAKLTALGYMPLRFGHEQVVGRPHEVAAAVRAALTRSAVISVRQA